MTGSGQTPTVDRPGQVCWRDRAPARPGQKSARQVHHGYQGCVLYMQCALHGLSPVGSCCSRLLCTCILGRCMGPSPVWASSGHAKAAASWEHPGWLVPKTGAALFLILTILPGTRAARATTSSSWLWLSRGCPVPNSGLVCTAACTSPCSPTQPTSCSALLDQCRPA
jgi:hypothetical protein